MKKVSLIIADQDRTYMESLANYIRNSDYATRFDVKLFSQKDRLEQYVSSEQHVDVLLASASVVPQQVSNYSIDTVILLAEVNEEEHVENHAIFKYQPISKLLSQVLTIHYEQSGDNTSKRLRTSESTKVISVYAATGGTGKTTVAFNLAREIADQDYRVFYLNLELVNSLPIVFDVEGEKSSSPLLYYIKTKANQLDEKIDEHKVTDEQTGIDYFNFIPSAEEMSELKEDEITALLEQMVKLERYDYIVIDLDSTLSPSVLTALKKSDHVYWLLNNDIQSFHKTSYLLEELHGFLNDGSFSDRVSLVLNRYTGKMADQLASYGLKVNAFLPYVPEWKQVRSAEQLMSNPVFNEYILKLYQSQLLPSRKAGVPNAGG